MKRLTHLDPERTAILGSRVEVARNFADVPMLGTISAADLDRVEARVQDVIHVGLPLPMLLSPAPGGCLEQSGGLTIPPPVL